MARLLEVLIIDDNPGLRINWKNLNITHYSTFEQIASEVVGSDRRTADIILIDVDMQHMAMPKGLNWGAPVVIPFGPMLALPFLRPGRPVAFWPISNFWSSNLMSCGSLVVSMALILSAINGQPTSLAAAQDWIANVKRDDYRDIDEALESALSEYRRALATPRGKPRLRNVMRADSLLEQQRLFCGYVSSDLDVEDRPVSIGVRVPRENLEEPGGEDLDEIELRSLFADFVRLPNNSDNKLHDDTIAQIRVELGRLIDVSEDIQLDLLDVVDTLLSEVDNDDSEDRSFAEILTARQDLWHPEHPEGKVRRFALLFAWVAAAKLTSEQPDIRLIAQVQRTLGIDRKKKHRDEAYRRFLTKADGISHEEYRTPFIKEEFHRGERAKAYSLGTQARNPGRSIRWASTAEIALTRSEVELCQHYARRSLLWDNEEIWPGWMK